MTEDDAMQRLESLLARALVVIERLEFKLGASQNPTLSLDETMQILGCKKSAFYAFVKKGYLRTIRVGRRTGVTRASIDEFLANLPRRRRTTSRNES